MRLIAGDVGGTKTYLALYERASGGSFTEVQTARYDSPAFHGLGPMVRVFLGAETKSVSRAAFGVAGPVVDDRCKATNLPWTIDARVLEADLGIERVTLLNDFQAIALAMSHVPASDLVVLSEREVEPAGPVAIIGAGTGLGEAILLPAGDGRPARVLASEGGHTDFAPRDETEMELLKFLLRRHKRVSYERVLSGPGLVTLYEFVIAHGLAPERGETRIRMQDTDPAQVIGESALAGSDPTCERAVDMFVSLYGAEAGNLALKVLPFGGLFVAGGIAAKLLPKMRSGLFMESFVHKGRMSGLLEGMRVAIVTNPRVGLLGARAAALAAAARQ